VWAASDTTFIDFPRYDDPLSNRFHGGSDLRIFGTLSVARVTAAAEPGALALLCLGALLAGAVVRRP
jgi:hypothetical protein